MNKNLIRRTALVAVASAASLVLAACGSGRHLRRARRPQLVALGVLVRSGLPGAAQRGRRRVRQGDDPPPPSGRGDGRLRATRAESAEVKKLADEIKKAQDPEVKTLSGWLTSWGEQVLAEGAMDHSMHAADGGMMTPEEMDNLKKAAGKAFDTAFMQLMIKHHEGAVAMAKTEKADGAFPEAKTMADAIITSQTAEVTRMNDLLGKS